MRRARGGYLMLLIVTLTSAGFGPTPRNVLAQTQESLGPEIQVAESVLSPAPDERYGVEVAAGDGEALAVWEDRRQCCDVLVYASRIDFEGRPLDPIGIALGEGSSGASAHVTWDGSQYIVVWEGYSPLPVINNVIYAARVTSNGDVLDEPPIVLAEANEQQFVGGPTVDSTGQGSLAAWSVCQFDGDRCRVDLAGAVIHREGDFDPIDELVTGPGSQSTPGVVAGPDGYLLSWVGGRDERLRVMALDRAGARADEPQLLAEGGLYRDGEPLQAAYSGGEFLFAWEEERGSNDYDVWGKRVMPSGAVLDQEAFLVASDREYDHVTDVRGAPDDGWVVVWRNTDDLEQLFTSTVDSEGRVENTAGEVLVDHRGLERDGALNFIENRAVLVWYSTDDRLHSVAADSIDRLQEADPFFVSQTWNSQSDAAAAWNGEVFLVAWVDTRGDPISQNVFASRITPSGESLDREGVSVFTDKHGWITPTVASDGRDFLIVWAYARNGVNRDIYAARVSHEGELLDSAPIVVSQARKTKAEPTVVWTGSHYLVAWEDYRNSGKSAGRLGDGETNSNSDIYGARINPSGDVLDAQGFRMVGGERNELTPQLAVSSGEVALAWSRDCGYYSRPRCTHDVFAAPLGAAGRSSGPPFALGTRSDHETLPALTSTPNGYLAAWTDWKRKSSSLRIRAIGADWALHDTTSLDTSDQFEYSPHLQWTGDHVVLSWIKDSPCIRCGGDVALLRLSQNGEPTGEPASVAMDEAYEFVTDVESNGSGCAATLYARQDDEPGVTRSFLRLLGNC